MFAAAVLSCACGGGARYVTIDGTMLGTTYHIVAETGLEPSQLYAEVTAIDAEAKASMSIFSEESLLSRINAGETDSLDCHIARNLAVAAEVHALSGGAYDVTVKPLTEAYGFAGRERVEHPNIDSILHFVGFEKLAVTSDNRIVKSDPRVQIDLNSIAKGYTVDLIAEMLEANGVANYIVEVGGEIRARGVNAAGRTWRVGIDTPIDGNDTPGANLATAVDIGDAALATSGNYRRYHVDAEGRKVVHTIDPRTGGSVRSRLLSATVIARDCTHADAMATMFMAMGGERAVELAEAVRDSVQVYFIMAGDDCPDDFTIFSTLKE